MDRRGCVPRGGVPVFGRGLGGGELGAKWRKLSQCIGPRGVPLSPPFHILQDQSENLTPTAMNI